MMCRICLLFAALGAAPTLGMATAKADILVTLSEQGYTSRSLQQTGTSFVGTISEGQYTFTIQTAITATAADNGGVGQLSSTSIFGSTVGGSVPLGALTITVQDVNADGSLQSFASTPSSYSVMNAATLNSTGAVPTTMTLGGSSYFNSDHKTASPVSLSS